MNNLNLIQVKLGFVSVFLLKGESGYVLVDAGVPGKSSAFRQAVERAGIDPADIRLVIITHAHYDHVGFLPEVLKWCNADLLIHSTEAPLLREGKSAPVRPTSGLLRAFMPADKQSKIPAAQPTIEVDDDYSLGEYGVSGRIIHTPGHTQGSLSVIVDEKAVLVGDIVMRFSVLSGSSFKPMVAMDMDQVYASWRKVLDSLPDEEDAMIFPSHGKPFPASRLRAALPE